jgi:hypothetical protein
MLVAGLLVALRVAACPHPYTQTQTLLNDGTPASLCCINSNCATSSDLGVDEETPLHLKALEQALCSPATETYSCCTTAEDPVICVQPNTEFIQCVDDVEEFVEILRTLNATMVDTDDVPGGGWPAVKCVEPAEPADLDGATVGTIVVVSLIGVALVGGAVAVHSGVAGV